jgi:glucosylceramidase
VKMQTITPSIKRHSRSTKRLRLTSITLLSLLFLTSALTQPALAKEETADYWITSANQQLLLSNNTQKFIKAFDSSLPKITINSKKKFQVMEGFGYTLNGGSAMHLMKMDADKRHAILTELFGKKDSSIGVSYIRLSLGASDLDAETFSYDDLPPGETDTELKHFSIEKDRTYLIPILKEIVAINPNINIMSSPWSPPSWMKSNNSPKGGELLEKYYPSYAQYFVKYIKAMAQEGIKIRAITVQNEPLHPGNNPSLLMHAWDQAEFIKHHLGPAFKNNKIDTHILIYDHNTDHVEYAITVLNDAEAKKYIHGSAFHLYGGTINELAKLKQAHPDKNIYFTEQWIGAGGEFGGDFAWHIENLIIGASRHWCKTVLEWNLAADPNLQPHTIGGCDKCLGAITIDGNQVTRNAAYYIIAQAAKFVPPDSVRIDSNQLTTIPNVAFLRPDGKIVLILLNTQDTSAEFNVILNKSTPTHSYTLPAKSAATLIL